MTAGGSWRIVFRGSSGFSAEVCNGLGRPAASDISAACPLWLFPPGLRCAPAQLPQTRVAQRWSLGFGLLRLDSGISVHGGPAGHFRRLSRGRAGSGVSRHLLVGQTWATLLAVTSSCVVYVQSAAGVVVSAAAATHTACLSPHRSQTRQGDRGKTLRLEALPRGFEVEHPHCPVANPKIPVPGDSD